MDTSGTPLLQTGIWLIPLVLLATIAGGYLLVRYWQRKTEKDLKGLRSDLRRLQTQRRQLAMQFQVHSVEDPEPFGSRMATLQAHLEQVDRLNTEVELQNVELQQRMRQLSANRWQATMAAPYLWYLIRKDADGLFEKKDALETALATASDFGQTFTGLAWEVALQAREAWGIQQRLSQAMEGLRLGKVSGETFEAATQQELDCKTRLSEIPTIFLASDEASLGEQADKDMIVHVHEIVSEIRPELERLYAQALGWEKQYRRVLERVASLRQALSNLEQALDNTPPELIVTPLKEEFDQLSYISENLHATLARLEVENIPSVIDEAGKVYQSAQQIDGQLKVARQKSSTLEPILTSLIEDLKQLSAQFAALGTSTIHPVMWGQGRDQLTTLSREITALGPIKKPRSLEQVDKDLQVANQLSSRQEGLAHYCQLVAGQHAELLALLAGPELSQGREWCQNAQTLAGQVALYDPENWSRLDNVKNLPGELQALADGLDLLAPDEGQASEPVPEAELPERLKNTRELVKFAQKLQVRQDHIRARLEYIQVTEKQAHEQADRVRVTLSQMGALVRSNSLLSRFATDDIGRFTANLKQSNEDLSQRQTGLVEKKAKAVSTLINHIEQSGNNWLDQLTKDLETLLRDLGNSLGNLESVAALDEQAIVDAKRVLASRQSFVRRGPTQKANFSLEELLPELKRRSDYWQECTAVQHAIGDIEQPLMEMQITASQNRQEARDQVAEITSWLRSTRVWPPTSYTMDAERQELDQIEADWKALKAKQLTAIALIAQLANLSKRYAALTEKTRQVTDRVKQEQAQVDDLETKLDDLIDLWQSQRDSHQDNPLAVREIQQLLNETNSEKDQLRGQYRQGTKDYAQVLQALQALNRKVRIFQIPLDDQHAIDVNGRVITYR
jgi:uncharacterized phage infection (PIP) family protein YhgE